MNTSRRSFLKKSAASAGALAFPTIIPASARGADGNVAPSNRITMASFGWGMQGPHNTNQFLEMADVQVVASCNVDKNHLKSSLDTINSRNGNKDAKGYHDYREVMARKDIDSVMLAVPDHWHALVAVEAAKNGKDIWGEKPLARTIAEQQAIVKAVQANKRIWQTGSWQRSLDNFRHGAEIVRNGLIGTLKSVEVGLPSGHADFARTGSKNQVTPPPAHLDYEMWVGPSQMIPYIEGRTHMNWRWCYNFGGGQLLDWIGHHCDIGHWGMDMDNGGPVEVACEGEFPPADAMWNTCTKYRGTTKYASGVTMTIAGGHGDIRSGTKWIGSDGWVWVDRGGFDTSHPELKKIIKARDGNKVVDRVTSFDLPDEKRKVKLYQTAGGHWRNFIDCIKSRQPTITPVETAHHSAIPGHLCLISMLVKRAIKWDPKTETIIGDPEASKLLTREYRSPWKLA